MRITGHRCMHGISLHTARVHEARFLPNERLNPAHVNAMARLLRQNASG